MKKFLAILIFLTTLISLGWSDTEPNGTCVTAETLTNYSTISGSLQRTGQADEYDYYKFIPTTNGNFSLTSNSLTKNTTITLYSQNCSSTLSTITGSGVITLPTYSLVNGSTYILMLKANANGNYSYSLTTTTNYTVTYNSNGSTGGSAPIDSNSPYNYNSTVTVLGNTGNLTKTGYIFAGWNTAADGSGTAYQQSNTFNITSNTILYAQWISPVADYRFDECNWNGTTGEVKDNSGNNLNGTGKNGVTTDSNVAIINNAAILNPSTETMQYIEIPDNNLLDGANKLTIMGWINPSTYTPINTNALGILSKRSSSLSEYAYGLFMGYNFTGCSKEKLVIDIDGTNNRFCTASNIPLNQWTHFTVTYDGTLASNQRVKVYLNGILDKTSSETSTSIPNTTAPLRIGSLYESASYPKTFKGSIDEIKIYNNALNSSLINSIYTYESSGTNYNGTSRTASCCCLPSGGNIIANPSFETLCQSTIIQTWNNVSGGTVNMRNNVCGWTMNGTGMETWENTTLKPASNGIVFVEIDGYNTTVDRLSQNLNTVNGTHYVISFDYRARNGGSDRIIAKWNGTEVGTFNGITTGWQTAQIEVVGTGSDILAFEEPTADNNSYGSWLDNIRVAEGTLATNCTSFTYEPYHSYNASLTPSYRLHTRISQQPFDLNVTVACAGSGTIPARKIKNIYAIDGAATSCNAATPKLFTLLSNGTYDINDTNKIITIPNLNITKAYSNIKLMLETNSSEFNCSNDAMAMRPTGYTFSSPSIKAGETVNVAAINGGTGYNGTANVTTALSTPNANCTTQTKFLSDPEPKLLTFNADANNSTLIGKDVSDINVTITDKIWTTIDNPNDCIINSNTTSYSGLSGKIGCDINSTLPLTITPYELNTTLQSFTVSGTGLQPWLYLDSNRTQHVEINTTIEAFGKDGTKTQNFSDACAGSDVPLGYYFTTTGSSPSNVNVSLTASTGSVNTVKEDNSESYTNVFNLQNFFTVTKSSFKNGDANLSLKFNFIRPTNPINPFNLKLTDINISNPNVIDNNATGLDKNATFVYGRARSYDIATNTSPINVPIEFEVYSTTSSGFVSGMPQNVLKWYRNLDHNSSAYGTVVSGSYTAGEANMTTISSPQDGIQTVTVTSTQDRTIHLDISPWLWYSLNPLKTYNYGTDCTQHPCFHYDFTDTTTGVQGVSSGTFQGSDFQMTPAKNITNKGVKLFR